MPPAHARFRQATLFAGQIDALGISLANAATDLLVGRMADNYPSAPVSFPSAMSVDHGRCFGFVGQR